MRLQAVHWEPLGEERLSKAVFALRRSRAAAAGAAPLLANSDDLIALQHLFAKSAPPKRDKSKPAASASAAKKQKAKGVGILDVRRASNVGIMLSKVRSR